VTHLANIAFRFVLVMGLVNLFADMTYESPIACRLSVCFGDRVPAPRLFDDWIGWWSPRDTGERTYDRDAIETTLRAKLPRGTDYALIRQEVRGYRPGPHLELTTDTPAAVMPVLAELARSLDGQLNLWARDLDPLGATLRRVVEDLGR
jgi:hypothetical protein